MDQKERRNYLVRNLIREQRRFHGMEIEQDETGARRQRRSLMNVRIEVIFNVWKDIDYKIYRKLLG